MNEETGDFGIEIFRAGKWVLTEECLYWDEKGKYPYPIVKERLLEKRPDNLLDKYDWPLHLIEKTWQTDEDIYNFNTVFFYALDYFQDLKAEKNNGCIWKTLNEQGKILQAKKTGYNYLK